MLSVNGLVQVTVNLTPNAVVGRSFGTLLIGGDSNVINGTQRYRTYFNLPAVALDFGTTAPEYLAASFYFGQTPTPPSCVIGRWLRTATAAQNLGGLFTSAEQNISLWNSITNGAFDITIDGSPITLTALNFSGVTNLNGVASVITTALSGAGTCTWTGQFFEITSATTGAGYAATGTITFTGTGTANDTITVNGLVITLVASGATGSQINIGGTAAVTAANLQYFLMNSLNADVTPATYSLNGAVITVTYKTLGTAGNSFTLAKSSTGVTISGADLAGGQVASSVGYATSGTGIDISAQLQLTAATAQALIPGYLAETPVAFVAAMANLAPAAFFGIMFAASVQPTDIQSIAVSSFVEGSASSGLAYLYGVTTQETNTLSSLVTTDLASLMQQGAYNYSMIQYSSFSPYAIASLFGRAFTVDYTANNTVITLMFKQEPGITAEQLTTSQAAVLQSKNCNVFVAYQNGTSIIQYGVVSSGQYIDTVQGACWMQNAVQTAGFNVLFTTPDVPQTNPGVNQILNGVNGVCSQAVTNGYAAPGVWNGQSFGNLATGQYLKTGYYIFAESIDLQSEADREARKCPPIQVAVKRAGAIQSIPDLLILVNS
jgi:hypothetical protein